MRTVEVHGERDLREMLDWAITQSPVNIALLDAQMRQLRLNASMCRVLGLPDEAAGLGVELTDLVDTAQAESIVGAARTVAATGKPTVWQGSNRMPGEARDHAVELSLSPVRDPAGEVRGVLVIAFDMTEQHLARKRLALVNEANTRIGTTLDMTRTAEELVAVAVPRLADFSTIDLLAAVFRGEEPTPEPFEFTAPFRRLAVGSILDGSPEALVRPGQVSAIPGHTPAIGRLTRGVIVKAGDLQGAMDRWAEGDGDRAAHTSAFGFHSLMIVPLRARGATLGIAVFARHRRPEPFEDDDLVLAEEIVARAAVCIDNARRFTQQRAAALTLQRSLLPQSLPHQAAVQVATRYLPADTAVAVGGDWFDVIRLSGSRVALVVGDVTGHGIRAAATMGQLRTAVRTLADIDLEPGELLTRLDDVVTRLADEEGLPPDGEGITDLSATCLYAVYDPVTRRCTLARAGHPPPAVVTPDGAAEYLDLPANPPLGLGGLPFEEAEADLPEGSLLVLYTDGLIESRQRDIDSGLNAMAKVLRDVRVQPAGRGRAAPPLESVCDRLVDALLPERAEDDAALLVARTRALPADRIATWDLPAEPSVVAGVRARTAAQVSDWGLEQLTFSTELIVSELLTNAIRHAQPPIQVRMILDDALSCEVSDGSSTAPQLRRAGRYDEGGRGLLLVASLADRWGSRPTRTGKTLWARQPLPPD
jgi:PAS domain S-box-containing protein